MNPNALILRGRFAALLLSVFLVGPIGSIEGAKESRVDGRRVSRGELIVKMRDEVDISHGYHVARGACLSKRYRTMPNLCLIELDDPTRLEEVYAAYKSSAEVETVSYNYIRSINVEPSDPFYEEQSLWGYSNIGQSNGLADADIDAPEGWDIVTDASEVVIAIVDTGVRYTHEDLSANMWINPAEIPNNGIDDDANGYIDDYHGINAIDGSGDPMDAQGHGTHVAGIAGAVGNNGKGVVGVAWNVKLMALRFLDENGNGTDADAIECIDYAISQGANIINNSWGGSQFNASLELAIQRAADAGILFVAAAGNEANDNERNPGYPASFGNANIVSVAATDRTDALAHFSNFGETSVDIAAPGVAIFSTYKNSDRDYRALSGTSMAAPIVSGTLALMKARFPSESFESILNRLYASVDPLASLARRCRTGGRLNLARALQSAVPSPLNDDFESATLLSSAQIASSGFNATASVQVGEPSLDPSASGKSVWWEWTAERDGLVEVSTIGSDFRTALSVFEGTALESLSLVARSVESENEPGGATLLFDATNARTYRFAVDGVNGESGNVSLSVSQAVENDDFANRAPLEGLDFRITARNGNASAETSEPSHSANELNPASRSVWWTWTSPISGHVTFSTSSSNGFDTVMSIYTGDAIPDLERIASDDDSGPGWTSEFTIDAIEGQPYHIAVDGWGGAHGEIVLAVATGENDNFINARSLVGDDVEDTAFSGFASRQASEPLHGDNAGGQSLWWTWTATRTGPAYVSTFGSDFDTVLGVYAGASLSGLTALGQSDDEGGSLTSRVVFDAVAGETYRIGVDGYRTANGADFGLIRMEAVVIEDPSDGSPVIEELDTREFYVGAPVAVSIDATRSPTDFGAIGLPEGLALDSATGLISGTPTFAGTFLVEIEVENAIGVSSLFETILVTPANGSPEIASASGGDSYELGAPISLSADASGEGELMYQWFKDGIVLAERTASALTIPSMSPGDEGAYSVVVSNSIGSIESPAILVTLFNEALANISTRGYVGIGHEIMIAGFVVNGDGPRRVLIRGVGQTLSDRFALDGALSDPRIVVFDNALNPIANANDWGLGADRDALADASAAVGGFALSSDLDAVLDLELQPGSYTAHLSGVGGAEGLALLEVYDRGLADGVSRRLVNLSTRLVASSGSNVAIGGFVIAGDEPKTVIIRAIGPGLEDLGIESYLPDPYMELFSDSNRIDLNDDWEFRDAALRSELFEQVGAFALDSGSFDATLVKTLDPGPYTVHVTDVAFREGICLLEVYELE